MAYQNKKIEHEKRKTQTGSYSLYNYLYHYLLDNYEPEQLESGSIAETVENFLTKYGIAYAQRANNNTDEDFVRQNARQAIVNFVKNKGEVGNDPHNFGRKQENSLDNIKMSLADLRW